MGPSRLSADMILNIEISGLLADTEKIYDNGQAQVFKNEISDKNYIYRMVH